MSIVYHGAPTHIYMCDTLPLDNPKIYSHLALPYITPDMSNTTWDRSSVTSMVMLTSLSAFGGGALMEFGIRMDEE